MPQGLPFAGHVLRAKGCGWEGDPVLGEGELGAAAVLPCPM